MGFSEQKLFRVLQGIFIALPFFYGMYYDFCGALMVVLSSGLLIFLLMTRGKLSLTLSAGLLLGILFAICSFVSVFYAVDSGMAASGTARLVWLPLFLLAYSQLRQERKEKLMAVLPYIGAALCLLGFMSYFIPGLKEYFYINGRLSSGFQYANTFALFLLTGIIVLYDRKTVTGKEYLTGAILLSGIALSGSRIVFVLTAVTLLYLIIRNRNVKLACGVVSLAALLLIYIYLADGSANIGRITTFSLTDSTLVGRFLYAEDALGLLLRHPFGMGHLGYYYMQNGIQTGVYSVQYVHNDLMQIGLDIGWIPMLSYLAAVISCLISGQVRHREKLMLSVIFIHGLLDFDLAYGAMLCIVLMIMSNRTFRWKGREEKTPCMAGRGW
ncbi:MAG: O-antigen ligase family protein, partial [Roseburia sp.]|nr:O-antigen ligase family protein [Roseburia sp.]